jgi:chaperonin GroEL (HSP60 family)
MPKRTDIQSILIIGAGPIVIGQACEFDYSGTQACKALREEGYRIILVNSNPATIMTDPDMADATYIEPITPEIVARIIEKERPDAVLPTMGGQTALNTALALFNDGTLAKYGCQMIGADAEAIDKAEDRIKFRNAMDKIGLESARSGIAHTVEEALAVLERTGLPSIIRPSFTLGGTGGGVAYIRAVESIEKLKGANEDETTGIQIVKRAIEEPLRQIVANCGIEGSIVVQKIKEGKGDFGFNARTEVYENLLKAGVIDPTKVTRIALENAASIAAMLLTTECVIADKPKPEAAHAHPSPDMGGMGGY